MVPSTLRMLIRSSECSIRRAVMFFAPLQCFDGAPAFGGIAHGTDQQIAIHAAFDEIILRAGADCLYGQASSSSPVRMTIGTLGACACVRVKVSSPCSSGSDRSSSTTSKCSLLSRR